MAAGHRYEGARLSPELAMPLRIVPGRLKGAERRLEIGDDHRRVAKARNRRCLGVDQVDLGPTPLEPGDVAAQILRRFHLLKAEDLPAGDTGLDMRRVDLDRDVVQHGALPTRRAGLPAATQTDLPLHHR